MRLTWKDAAATLVTAVVVALYGAYLAGAHLPLVSGPRALAGAVLVLGIVGCALGGGTVGQRYRIVRYTVASVLGTTVLVAGLSALLSGNGAALGVLVVTTVALWATTTTFHLYTDATAPGSPVTRELAGHGRGGTG